MADGVFTNSYMDNEAADDATRLETLYMALFVNNVTPAVNSTSGTFTEATYAGYARQLITGATPNTASGGVNVITCDELTFAVTGTGGTDAVYGYYLISSSSGAGTVKGGVKLTSTPYPMATAGDTLKITPTQTNTTP